jgi:hypothetical protein
MTDWNEKGPECPWCSAHVPPDATHCLACLNVTCREPSGHLRARGAIALALVIVAACSSGAPAASPAPSAVPASEPAAASPALAVASACPSPPGPATQLARLGRIARSGPESGVWVGVNLDWASQSVAALTADLGAPPADVVTFVSFPLTPDDGVNLAAAAEQARAAGAVLIVTLQPWAGLAAVTDAAIADIVSRLALFGSEGVPSIVRFAHEMNGAWYPWSQDPAAYTAAFRRVADAVHAGAPSAAMLWAPNQGQGYPYAGGQYEAAPGSPAARLLDTNGNGRLDAGDDPYAPYWPGAAYVDWVGMSLYHWGTTYPWGANTVTAPGKFAALITGAATAASDVPVPDFYAGYAARYGKPLAIVETAALYRPGGGGASESAIKTAWLGQVLSPATRTRFPLLRIVNWFEWRKTETEVHAVVDWRIAADPALRAAFIAALTGGFELGPAVPPAALSAGWPTP